MGYAEDVVAEAPPWSFDPAAIAVPTLVHHGDEDTVVPLAHGRHTAAVIPAARLAAWPHDGHVSVLGRLPALVALLADTDGTAP